MNRGHDLKNRQIRKSLHRRSRMRRAYFKMLEEETNSATKGTTPGSANPQLDQENSGPQQNLEIDLSDAIDSEDEEGSNIKNSSNGTKNKKIKVAETIYPKKLTGKQLASKKRAEIYIKQKQAEELLNRTASERIRHKKAMTKRTSKGQPKLGSQMGVLLDKIRKSS